MNISEINISQAMQNAIRPAEKGEVPAPSRSNIPAPSAPSVHEAPAAQVPARGLVVSIDYVKQQLDNILVNYPPFFPLGTFQRLDLIKSIRTIEDQIPKSSVPEELKRAFSGDRLPANASDQEISTALNRLFQFRDAVSQDNTVKSEKVQPGAILDLTV